MRKNTKALNLMICFIAVVCLFCFVAFSLASGVDKDHECVGEKCEICLLVSVGEQTAIDIVALSVATGLVALTLLLVGTVVYSSKDFTALRSPVCLKVKLLD